MSWFTPPDLASRLSPVDLRQLSTQNGQATTPDNDVLQLCLDRAEAEVRGVLAGRSLPGTPEGLLREVSLDLAVEALFLRKPGASAQLSEGWDSRIRRSRALLDRMADGSIVIGAAPSTAHRLEVLDPGHSVDGAFA